MKKLSLALMVVLIVIMGTFCFTACGDETIEGTYYLKSLEIDGVIHNVGDMVEEGEEKLTLSKEMAVLNLQADGKAYFSGMVFTNTGILSDDGLECIWKLSEDKKTIILTWKQSDIDFTVTIDDKTLILEFDDTNIIIMEK